MRETSPLRALCPTRFIVIKKSAGLLLFRRTDLLKRDFVL
jgi:hypothetical protein